MEQLQEETVLEQGEVSAGSGQRKFWGLFFALLTLTLLMFFAFKILNKLKTPENIANTVPNIQYTPADLVASLDKRLAYLQKRTSGVSFYIYTIQKKDNLWKIGSKRRYSVHTLIGCNPQLETYDVSIGQKILVPSRGGILHIVQKDDSWEAIAKRYKTTLYDVKKFNLGMEEIVQGDMVFVYDRRPDMELMNDKMREKYELRALFVSPLGGRLTSVFGMRKHPVTGARSLHGGIDIAVKEGTWVGAAADGIVILAGDGIGHYGKAVFIDHQDGYITHYGHLSRIMVHEGKKVKARQLIAKSGSTGRSTGPHLHFTIKKNDVSKDPLKFIW